MGRERGTGVDGPVERATSSSHLPVCMHAGARLQAGMLALRRDGLEVNHEDFVEGIVAVQAKKKTNLNYMA